jgi:hypothetical protein
MSRPLRLVVVLVPLLAAVGCGRGISVSVEVPREQIQKKVESKFPVEFDGTEQGRTLHLTLTDPVIILEDGKDQIGLKVNLVAKTDSPADFPPPAPRDGRFTGTATLFASVSYDADKKAIVLSDPKITELSIDQLPGALAEPLRRLAEKAVAEKFARHPIPLEGDATLDRVRGHLKSISVRDGKVVLEIGL